MFLLLAFLFVGFHLPCSLILSENLKVFLIENRADSKYNEISLFCDCWFDYPLIYYNLLLKHNVRCCFVQFVTN